MKQDNKSFWEILVPSQSNEGLEYCISHHQEWDRKVRELSGGLTILKTTKGQWISPDGKIFHERMIPVRIYCSDSQIEKIIDLTIEHYDQEAVLAYELSSNVKLVYRNS